MSDVSYANLSQPGSVTVKTGSGILQGVQIVVGRAGVFLTLYDGSTANPPLMVIDCKGRASYSGAAFTTGLTAVLSGAGVVAAISYL